MEDVILIYPDFEDNIILNYFKGTIIKNGVDATFFFENNNLKIKWNSDIIDEFYLDSSNNELTRYIYIPVEKDIKSINKFFLNKLYIKDDYCESSCIIDNCYIYNELNNYKGIYYIQDDILNIKWEHEEDLKKYFQESNDSTTYFLCSDYEKKIKFFNINITTNEKNEFVYFLNIKNMNIYSVDSINVNNSDKKIGIFNLNNKIISLYIKNNEYLYECLDNNLNHPYYYSINFFKNNYYQNIILNNKYYIFDKINNLLFEKYNRIDGTILNNIFLKDNKLIIDNKIFECNLCNDNIDMNNGLDYSINDYNDSTESLHNYYDNTHKYNETIYIKHETWEEECIINIYLNSFYRKNTNEYENMVINDYFLIVYWKMWSPELFIFNGNNTDNKELNMKIYKHDSYYDFLLKNDFQVIHSNWYDLCKFDNLKIIRQSNQEDGILKLNEKKEILIINWTNWDEECFYILNNILYSIEFIYYIYDNSNSNSNIINKPKYILNKYNNELFKINYFNSNYNCNYDFVFLEKIEFIEDCKLIINGIIYFYKYENHNIQIYLNCYEINTLFKDNKFNVKLNIITNEIIYENDIYNDTVIIYGKYFIENNNIDKSIYLNIYWDNGSYNEIYKLLDNNIYYYEKYLNYSLKSTYILYDINEFNDYYIKNINYVNDKTYEIYNNEFKFDYFNQYLYNERYLLNFLKNKNNDKFYLLINDEIKEFFIYNFDDDVIFLLNYNYNYLNNDRFCIDIYRTYLLYILKLDFVKNISNIDLFKIFLKRIINNDNDIYSYKSFIKKYLKDPEYDKHNPIFYKDIVNWIKNGGLIKIYEKHSINNINQSKTIIILNYDDINSYNIKFIKNIYDSNLKYDIIINFNTDNISFIDIIPYYYLINLSNIIVTISHNLSQYQILFELNKYISNNYDNIIFFKNNTLLNNNLQYLNNYISFINYNKILLIYNNIESKQNYKLLKINYSNKRMKHFHKLYNIVYSSIDLIQILIFYYILNRYIYKIVNYNFIIKTDLLNHILL